MTEQDIKKDYLTKHFSLICKKCKSDVVLMSIDEEINKIITSCTKCGNRFEIKFKGIQEGKKCSICGKVSETLFCDTCRNCETCESIVKSNEDKLIQEGKRLADKKLRKENKLLKRTLEIMSDKKIIKGLKQALEDFKEGRYITLEKLEEKKCQ